MRYIRFTDKTSICKYIDRKIDYKGYSILFLRFLFIFDNEKQYKDLLIPSHDLSIKELLIAEVYINSASKICHSQLLILITIKSDNAKDCNLVNNKIKLVEKL